MRLPFSKVYRAFPELDGFTDVECRHLIDRIRRRNRVGVWLIDALTALCFLTGFFALGGVLTVLTVEEHGRRSRSSGLAQAALDVVEWAPALVGVVGIAGAVGLMIVPGLWARDRFLRPRIAAHLERARCPACSASLMGSARTERRVTCMACGQERDLRSMGLESDDLGPALIVPEICGKCGYALAGLRVHRGKVTCPECGTEARAAADVSRG